MAVARLTQPGDAQALSALLVAGQDPDPRVRAAAAVALGARGGTRAVEALSVLLADPDPYVGVSAARALAVVRPESGPGDARETAALQQLAGKKLAQGYGGASSRVREEIATAMAVVGAPLRDAVEAEARLLWDRARRGLEAGSPAARAGAAEELGRSGTTEAVRTLTDLLQDRSTDPVLAAGAARGLGWSSSRAALAPLEDALRGGVPGVVQAAVWALGALGDPDAAPLLDDVAWGAGPELARSALAGLEGLPQAAGVGASLCEVALRAADPAIAAQAASSARARGAECPDGALVSRLGRGGRESLGPLAALGALGLPRERLKAPAEKAIALLAPKNDVAVRIAATEALGLAPYPPATAALQARLSVADPRELAAVVLAVARLDPTAGMASAAPLASSPEPVLRAAVARVLGVIRGPDAAAPLAALAADADLDVRCAAYASLGALGGAGVAPLAAALAAQARNPDDVVAIARALGATGVPEAVLVLSPLLSGPHVSTAATAIGRVGAPGGVTPLLEALRSSHPAGRLEIVEALGQLGSADAGDELSRELLSDRPAVRAAAARALGKIRHEPAALRLEALRADYHADVRRAAREAVARLPAAGVRRP